MDGILENAKDKMNKTIDSMLHKFSLIRAGRANTAILDKVKVECYGAETPLNQIATISIPEAKQLAIRPFDKNLLGEIEKAIFAADLGLTPNNNGEIIYIVFPPLTEERRRDYVKQVKTMAEEAKIAIRNIRQDANNAIKKDEASKDEQDGMLARVQDLVNDYNKKVDELLKEKETDLMSV